MERRKFIQTTSAGIMAGMLMPEFVLAGISSKKHIGLQLYSLRDEIAQDLEGSLEKIAAIGYKNVEAASYSNGMFYGLKPADFRKLVEKYGMKAISSHATFKDSEIAVAVNAHREAGIPYIVWPWIGTEERTTIDNYKTLAEKFNTIGMICRENDLNFGYHNHDFEFYPIEGKIPYDLLLESTDPAYVFMQIDLYWIVYAGKDPIALFEKYPGRFALWHVKDMAAGKSKKMTEVGSGVIDYKTLFEYASVSGMKEFFVEQDEIEGDGFESLKKSFNFLNNNI
ncbi:MAG: sugar phosphate isomerase/epimerase [Bacteroidales bacterium]|nr:sugar phosphate isomerase/epimerase [Bacteroidales bacterium]